MAISQDSLATVFALAFLMPEQEFRVVAEANTKDGVVDTAAIASHFHVSISDAAARGVTLGILKW